MNKYFLILVSLLFTLTVIAQGIEEKPGFSNLKISPNGEHLIFSHDEQKGLYIFNTNNNNTRLIENNKFSAYQASFSFDGNFVAYKKFIESENSRLQQPVLYNIQTGETTELFQPVRRCGTPSFAANGTIVFTIGKDLYLTNPEGEVIKSVKLPAYSNLAPVAADGEHVVFNDSKDRLWLFNLTTSEKRRVSPDDQGYFEPHWSPNGQNIVASSLSGELEVFNRNSSSVISIGKGKHPVWTDDGKRIIYSKAEVMENRQVLNQDLYIFDIERKNASRLTDSDEWEDYPTIKGNSIYYSTLTSGELFSVNLSIDENMYNVQNRMELNPQLNADNLTPPVPSLKKKNAPSHISSAVYFDIPYVNQRYDTPDWFNGNWACGATAAIQCISYFGLVRQWPVLVSSPYSHISDYGNYICEIYTYNGTTFNIGGADPNGTIGYGGYGYIIKNNWADTKGYMRDYAIIHGLSSAVDWGETREKLAIEITNENPFVLLNSLTTSGHYISVIGYDNIDTTTIIVNDPYGNKNLGYANFYGRRAYYDWPGYNNGYENLNQVHCFIYFRGDPPADIAVQTFTVQVDTAEVNQNIFVSTEISNIGKEQSVASTIEIIFSKNAIYDENATILDTYALPALQVGQTHVLQDTVSLPDSLISEAYKLSVFADADTLNAEMLKDNNVLSTGIVINGYPRLYAITPEDRAVITDFKPEVRVKFQDKISGINLSNVKLYMDNVELTDSCFIGTREISYIPSNDLLTGTHYCKAEIPNFYGLTTIYNWSFEIQLPSNIDIKLFDPDKFYLSQNYPNPFNPITIINYQLPMTNEVELSVYNLLGQKVVTLVLERQKAGHHQVEWDASGFASGVYVYRIVTDNGFIDTKKLLLLK